MGTLAPVFCVFLVVAIVGIHASLDSLLQTRARDIQHVKRAQHHHHERVSYNECSIPGEDRNECGYYGITEGECSARECCWAESDHPGVPWCYNTVSQSVGVCEVDEYAREDCGFYGINIEQCKDLGCCWKPSNGNNVPWCFFSHAPETSGSSEGQCGVPAITPNIRLRIVGGRDAIEHSWPWQVSLQSDGSHFCGGSIISPRWILSAAHCAPAFDYSDSNTIIVGMHHRLGSDPTKVTVDIEEIIPHPEYDSYKYDKDLMLIKLSEDLSFNDAVAPVCLPRHEQQPAVGMNCYTTGWGTTTQGGSLPNDLQQVMVPILSRDTCNQGDWYDGDITENMVCAGYEQGGKDSCQGDSGGPLVCRNEAGSYILTGVVSWGEGCAQSKRPGLYSNVANFVDWIYETIDAY